MSQAKLDMKGMVKFREHEVKEMERRLRVAQKTLTQAKKTQNYVIIDAAQNEVQCWKNNLMNAKKTLRYYQAEYKKMK